MPRHGATPPGGPAVRRLLESEDVVRLPLMQRLHWQMFLTHLVVIGLVVASLGVYFYGYVERSVDDVVEEELAATAELAVAALEPLIGHDDLSPLLQRVADRTSVRLTLVNSEGEVIADSTAPDDPSGIANHGTRPEIVGAMRDGTGADRRVSDTVGIAYYYYARRIDDSARGPVLVRVALPYGEVSDRMQGVRTALLLSLLVSMLVGGVLSFLVAKRITSPVVDLSHFARDMGMGRFDTAMPDVPAGELEVLSLALQGLRDQLSDKLAQLEEEKTLLLTMLGAMTEGVIVVDATGRVILVNPKALELLGVQASWTPQTTEGRQLIEVTRHPALIDVIEHVVTRGESRRDELETTRGVRRYMGVSVAPLLEEGAIRGAVAVLYDLTQVRQLERVRQDFVANVSHELRTPIAAIKGWAETLTSGIVETPPFVEEQLHTIHRHAERLAALVNDLLALARVEATGLEEAFVEVELDEIVEDVVEGLREAAEQRDVQLTMAVDTVVRTIRTEPRALEYVIRNLLENAVKYSNPGGRAAIHATADDADALVISVRDEGVGIAEQHLPRIFERFYRVDKGRSRDVGGTGLGLSIVKHFATALGGRVEVESELGRGSCFRLILPAESWQYRHDAEMEKMQG